LQIYFYTYFILYLHYTEALATSRAKQKRETHREEWRKIKKGKKKEEIRIERNKEEERGRKGKR
jgi:hypothetical protein